MANCKKISWNVHGLNSQVKGSVVFQFLQKHPRHICILQETPLVGGRILSLKKPWVGYNYHSMHTDFSRGVSRLVHKSLPFKLLDIVLDSDRRYVIIHAVVHSLEMVLVGLYLPPAAPIRHLYNILAKLASFSTDNILIMGDFNMVPDP